MRNKVDFPDPDWPNSATISPSFRVKSTFSKINRSEPSADLKDLFTERNLSRGVDIRKNFPNKLKIQALFGEQIKSAPNKTIKANDKNTHHANT